MLTALSIRDIVLVDVLDLEIEDVHQHAVADGEGGQHWGAVVRV